MDHRLAALLTVVLTRLVSGLVVRRVDVLHRHGARVRSARGRARRETVQKRLFGFAVVGGLGALLVAVRVAEMVLAMIDGFLSNDAVIDTALRLAGSVVPIILGTLLLGMIFRFGPDVEVPWRAIWPGTLLTTALLLVGAWGYGVYVDTYSSVTGVASSAVLLIVSIYFMAQIFVFGAGFIKVLARRRDLDLVVLS